MIRNDFVSNSSSSSFIISKNIIFEHYNIKKDDILSILNELYNGKGFELYDLQNELDSKLCHDKYDKHLSNWLSQSNEYYKDFMNAHYFLYGIGLNLKEIYCHISHPEDIKLSSHIYNLNTYHYDKLPSKDIIDLVKCIKILNHIQTMREVLCSKYAQFFIHFDTNMLFETCDITLLGIEDIKDIDDYNNKEIECEYKTENYSAERFIEILIDRLSKKSLIDLKNKSLLSKIREQPISDKLRSLTPYEVFDILNVDYVLHEG